MKNEQNLTKEQNEGRALKTTSSNKSQLNQYKDVFTFKKKFDINKFEKLDIENRAIVENKLKQLKEIQIEITNLLK
jgi:hypothetical protein